MLILAGIDDAIGEITGPLMVLGIVVAALANGYLKRRMRHKEIMAAIEKGVPLTELKINVGDSPKWVGSIYAAIVCLIIGLSVLIFAFIQMSKDGTMCHKDGTRCYGEFFGILFIGMIPLAFGIGNLVRGLLLRKAEKSLAKTEDSSKPQ